MFEYNRQFNMKNCKITMCNLLNGFSSHDPGYLVPLDVSRLSYYHRIKVFGVALRKSFDDYMVVGLPKLFLFQESGYFK